MNRPLFPLLLAGTFLLGGCGTIFNGPNQRISVVTRPPGATASCGKQQVITPGKLVVPRSSRDARVVVELPGYRTVVVPLERSTSGLTWLNFVTIPAGLYAGAVVGANSGKHSEEIGNGAFGAIVGAMVVPAALVGVDAASGGGFELSPAHIDLDLLPDATPGAAALR